MRHRAARDLIAFPLLCALAGAGFACGPDHSRASADSARRVSLDSGALSPTPVLAAVPALADTGEKRSSSTAVAETVKKVTKVPAGAELPPSQVPPLTPPEKTATHSPATPSESTRVLQREETRTASVAPPAAPTTTTTTETPSATTAAAVHYAFGVGEKLDYQVKFGPMSVGSATMEVIGLEPVRGTSAYHTSFNVRGGVAFYKVNDRYESWFDPRTYSSMRFNQNIDEGSYEVKRNYEIFPERQTFSENGKPEEKSASDPLDEAALIYLLRIMPLEVGKTYDLDRYFKPDRNPVRVQVVRKERITVPAGTFHTIVVRPIIKTKGMFSEGGHAEVWFSDDSVRTMVQLKSQLKIGSLSLYLKSARAGVRPTP
jgi:Protein of unknown function (DUF3108)